MVAPARGEGDARLIIGAVAQGGQETAVEARKTQTQLRVTWRLGTGADDVLEVGEQTVWIALNRRIQIRGDDESSEWQRYVANPLDSSREDAVNEQGEAMAVMQTRGLQSGC